MQDTSAAAGPAPVSAGLAAVVAHLAEYKIAEECGRGPDFEVESEAQRIAELVARAELPAAWYAGADHPEAMRRTKAHRWLSALVSDAMAARRCQCTAGGHPWHEEVDVPCTRHFEDDAPVLEGKRMCLLCHSQVSQSLPAA